MKTEYLSYLFIIFVFISCAKKQAVSSEILNSKELEIIWKKSLRSSSGQGSLSMSPVLYKDMLVINTEHNLDGHNAPVLFLDTSDGTIIDYWSDYIDGNGFYVRETSASEDKYLILCTFTSIDCINIETAKTQWQSVHQNIGPLIYIHDSYVYAGITKNNGNAAAIIRSPLDHQEWDTVYNYSQSDNFKPNFDAIGFGESLNSDEIVVWKNRSYTGSTERTDIFAYNISADSLLWRNNDLNNSSGVLPLQIDNEVVFGVVYKKVFALSLKDGNMLWERNFNDLVDDPTITNFDNGAMYVDENLLILKGDSDEMIFLNKNDGTLTEVVSGLSEVMRSRFTYFQGKLFFSSGDLMAISLSTKESLINSKLSKNFEIIRSEIVIAPLRRVFYFHDGYYVYCVKIPKDL